MKPGAALRCYLGAGGAGRVCRRGWGTARPAKPPLLLGRGTPLRTPAAFLRLPTHSQTICKGRLRRRLCLVSTRSLCTYRYLCLPPPSKTSCFTPTSVLLRIFLVRHLRSLPIRRPMYNQTFGVGFFFFLIYINGGDISHRRRTRPCDGSCLYIARRLWHATFSQSFVAR